MMSYKSLKSAAVLMVGTAIAPLAFAGGQGQTGYMPDLLPSNPNTGECYARVEVPAQYSTGSESVLVEEGYSKMEVTQPVLAERQENVMIKEASVRYQVRQPSYRSVTEQMMVRPAYDKLSVSAPQFSTVTETIQTSAPRLVWKRGNPGKLAAQGYTIHSTANGGSYSPGEQVQFNRKVMTSHGQVQRQTVPAKYRTIHKQVVSDPGGVEEIPVPAQYRSVTVEDVVDPGGERHVNVPPKYADVATKHLISPSRYEWRRVLCAPGTGTIKSSTTYSAAQSAYSSGSTHTSGSTYHSGAYTSGTAHHGASAGTVSGSRVVTGTGYYGGYDDAGAVKSSDHYSGTNHHYKAKRKRRKWH